MALADSALRDLLSPEHMLPEYLSHGDLPSLLLSNPGIILLAIDPRRLRRLQRVIMRFLPIRDEPVDGSVFAGFYSAVEKAVVTLY